MLQVIHVKLLGLNHLWDITCLHMSAFPKSALTLLGKEAVKKYYDWQMTGPHEAVALGAFLDEKLVGILFGGKFNGATTGFLQRNRIYLILRVISHPWLITNPLFRKKLNLGVGLLDRINRQKKNYISDVQYAIRSFGILVIAVHPEHQKQGVGKILMDEAERVASEKNYQLMHLTVEPNNVNAIQFYEKLGWIRQTQHNIWQGYMKKYL